MGINVILIRVSLYIALGAYFIVLLKKKESILQVHTSKQYLRIALLLNTVPFFTLLINLLEIWALLQLQTWMFSALLLKDCVWVFVEAGENGTWTDMLRHKCLQFDSQNSWDGTSEVNITVGDIK